MDAWPALMAILTDEDTADRYVYHRGVVTRLVNR
jgi:hypothetical protein